MSNNADTTEDPFILLKNYSDDYDSKSVVIWVVVLVIIGLLATLCKYLINVCCAEGSCHIEETNTEHEPLSRTIPPSSNMYQQHSSHRSSSADRRYYNATLEDTNDDYFSRYGLIAPHRTNVGSLSINNTSASIRSSAYDSSRCDVDASANTPSRSNISAFPRAYTTPYETNTSQRRIYNVTMDEIRDDYLARYDIHTPNRDSSSTLNSNNAGATNRYNVRTPRDISSPNRSNSRALNARDSSGTTQISRLSAWDDEVWRTYISESSLNNTVPSVTINTRERPPPYSEVVVSDLAGENRFSEVIPQISEAPPPYDAVKY